MPRGTGRYDEARLQGRLWTPRQLPNGTIACWFDANGQLISAAGAVSQWTDLSSQGNNFTQVTGANQPTLVPATGPNGLATISFNGSTHYFVTSNPIAYNSAAGYTTYGVVQNDGTAASRSIHSAFSGTGSYQLRINAGHDVLTVRSGITGLIVSDVITSTGAFHIIGGSLKLNFSSVSVNGVEKSDATNPGFTGAINVIGVSSSAEYFSGKMGELIFCSTMLESWDRRRVEGYLAWKWGLQGSLVAGHAYKNYPPVIAPVRTRSPQLQLALAKTIVPDAGVYALTGTSATLARGVALAAGAGSYAMSGTDTTTRHNWRILALQCGA